MEVNGTTVTLELAREYEQTSEKWLHMAENYHLSLNDWHDAYQERAILALYKSLLNEAKA